MTGCGPGMLLWALLFVVLVVGGIWLAVRAWRGGGAAASSGSSALRILEDRFARGEIDRDEFEDRRRALGS